MLSEQAYEATLRWRQSVSSTHNDHLSLVQINENDRWGVLAVLTEALRQESMKNHGYGPDPVGKSPVVNFAHAEVDLI